VGTVLTGTVHRGKIKVKDIIEVKPIDKSGQVRSLRSFGETKEEAVAGERVGVAVKDIKPDDAHRGFMAVTPGSIKSTQRLTVELEVDKYYQRALKLCRDVTAFVESSEVLANVVPGVMENGKFIVKNSVKAPERCLAYLELRGPVVVERGDRVLLVNPGLQAREFRIIGGGRITETGSKPEFFSKKTKVGTVRQKQEGNEYVIGDLFCTNEVASKFLGSQVVSSSGTKGEIVASLRSNGDVIAKFRGQVLEGEKVFVRILRKLRI
jgi:selenocysteine-specific elongation factor